VIVAAAPLHRSTAHSCRTRSVSYAEEIGSGAAAPPPARKQQFPSVGEWVYEWFAPTFVRRDDAEFRWWLEHCDPHLRVITAAGGPFGACSQGKGHLGESAGLKVVPMPEGWLKHK